MNTEKLRELERELRAGVDRLRNVMGKDNVMPAVVHAMCQSNAKTIEAWADRLAAIIAEEEAREPVGYVAQEDLRWLHAGAGVEIRETLMASRSYADRSVPLYTQPPSAGGEK